MNHIDLRTVLDFNRIKTTQEIEAELPLFLRSVGLLLELGLPFIDALEESAKDCPSLGPCIKKIIAEVHSGASFSKTLADFAISFDSPAIKRAVGQLLFVYESGSRGTELIGIADDLMALQQHALRDYAAKNSLFGLLFVIVSAILPTMFLIYASIGKFIAPSSTPISPSDLPLALLVIFPSLSILILLVSKASAPRIALSTNGSVSAQRLSLDLRFILPALVFLAIYFAGAAFALSEKLMLVPALLFSLVIGGFLVHDTYMREKRSEELDASLPDALLSISGLPKSTPLENVFALIAKNSPRRSALVQEAEITRRQLSMNIKPETAMDDLALRSGSGLVRRMANTLALMARTNSLNRISLLANDMMAVFRLQRERAQTFMMQKYTLVLGALLIPLILGTALSLLHDMGSAFGSSTAELDASIASVSLLAPAYLVIYATIASAAIAEADGKKSEMVLMFALMSVLGLAVFWVVG